MRTHTSQFKNELKNMGRQIDSIITYGNTTLHDELYAVTPHFEASLLKSVMKQLDIESSVIIPIGTTVNYQLGVKVGNAYEYMNYGNYVVYSIEKIEDTDTYKIICYDKMLYSMKEYESLGVTYPINIRNFINALCTKVGLVFKDTATQFANYDKIIENELYLDVDGNSLGYTYRDVFDELAQVTASIICIDPSTDKVQIKYPNQTNDTINEEFLKDVNVKFGEKYGPINTIVLSRSAGADNVYYPDPLPQNPCEIKITDNQIMNWNDRDIYLPDIYNKLNGLEYYINDFSSTGILYYELGDFYNVSVGSTTYKCLMLNDEINITQGIEELIHTEILEEAQTDYTKADKTDRRINQTYLIVNKQNQEIEAVINTTKEIKREFETLQDIDGFAEGKYIYLDDASDELITSAKFNGETSQEGTPSPDYPSEIKNLEGKNIFDEVLENGGFTGTGLNAVSNARIRSKNYIPVQENTNYTISVGENNIGKTLQVSISYYDTNDYTTARLSYLNWVNLNNSASFTTPANCKYIRFLLRYSDSSAITKDDNFNKFMIQEGSVATPYVPYNSLEVKVIGKNLLDKNKEALGSNVTKTVLDTGVRVTTKVAGNARYCGIEIGKDELLGKKVTISANITVSGTNNASARLFFGKYNTPSTSGIGTALTSTGSNTVTIPNTFYSGTDRIYLLMYSSLGSSEVGAYVDYTNLQVEIGEEATEYEEYKEQTVYFPLAEGQKLYEGSYPADDGIHNVRGQIVFDGSSDENWIKGSYPKTGTVQMQIQKPANFFTETGATAVAKLNCSHFKSENQVVNGMALGGMFNVYPSTDLSITTAAEFKTWLSNNPMTLEYPLAEEEIIPYNTEQQAAWNSIRELHTYKTVTHIYSDAYAEIGYIKDNMLSGFETKASARLTQQDVQQLKIENGKISTEVSSTQSQLNNYYTKNEADNNTNSTKAELENIIQQNKTEIEQTTQEIALRVTDIETNGVDKIETSMGYTFNNEGLNIDKEGAATASTIDNEAFKVKNKSSNENVFFAGYVSDQDSAYRGQTIVESTNLVVKNYLNIEGASRFQPYVNPVLGGHGTGAFDIG